MKTTLFWNLVALLSANLALARVLPATPPLTVAVFDFEAREDLGRGFGRETAGLLTAYLSADPSLWLVERSELDKVLDEQALGLSGLANPETAAKVGHLIGAKVLVTGRAFQAGGELILVAKIIGTETSRVFAEPVKGAKNTPITGLAEQLAGKLATNIVSHATNLVAAVPTREDRVAKIKTLVKTDKRPSVAVKIPEVHFGTPAVDPAAQTELAIYFKEIGCALADDQSAKAADLEIVGEAFSEMGMRRSGLVSCKARVEIKVRDRATGKVLLVERQTGMAIDVSEQIAAKHALQEAAADLAVRIIPQVLK